MLLEPEGSTVESERCNWQAFSGLILAEGIESRRSSVVAELVANWKFDGPDRALPSFTGLFASYASLCLLVFSLSLPAFAGSGSNFHTRGCRRLRFTSHHTTTKCLPSCPTLNDQPSWYLLCCARPVWHLHLSEWLQILLQFVGDQLEIHPKKMWWCSQLWKAGVLSDCVSFAAWPVVVCDLLPAIVKQCYMASFLRHHCLQFGLLHLRLLERRRSKHNSKNVCGFQVVRLGRFIWGTCTCTHT